MIRRTKEGFCVEMKTAQPANDYHEMLNDIIGVLQCSDPEMRNNENYFYLFELLKNMLPDSDQAELIFEDLDEE